MTQYIMILLEEVEGNKKFEIYSKFNDEDYPTEEHVERYVQECIEDYSFGGCNDPDEVGKKEFGWAFKLRGFIPERWYVENPNHRFTLDRNNA